MTLKHLKEEKNTAGVKNEKGSGRLPFQKLILNIFIPGFVCGSNLSARWNGDPLALFDQQEPMENDPSLRLSWAVRLMP